MATYCSHNDTSLFLAYKRVKVLLSFPYSLFSVSQKKCRSIFHSLHGLDCGQIFEFRVGREYNYASFQLLSSPLFQKRTAIYLCFGSKKPNKANITPTCWRLWSPSLRVTNSFFSCPCLLSQTHMAIFMKSCHVSLLVSNCRVLNKQTQ